MKYLRQVIFELRHQKLMSWLSIIGTSIAIFLVMSDFMIYNMDNVSVAPESRRPRIVYGFGSDFTSPFGGYSGFLSYDLAREIYDGLEGVESVAYSGGPAEQSNVSLKNKMPELFPLKVVDENYWEIYDYTFLEGSPFTKEEVESGVKNVILSKSVAEQLFGKQSSYIGKEIIVKNKPWVITGIIKDVNPLLNASYAGVFIPHIAAGYLEEKWSSFGLGSYVPALLLKEGVSVDYVRQQIKNRYGKYNERRKLENIELIYHNQPYTLQESLQARTNMSPDLSDKYRMRIIGYLILLIIPAINLSSMTRSRMSQRVSEIGLRRAFGCTRMRIIFDLLAENLVLTLIGGVIGLLFCIIFILGFSNYYIAYGGLLPTSLEILSSRPSFEMLFSWKAFGIILVFCFILNILSAGVPATKAALINPAEALNGQNAHK
ncbi:MAG: ABC transporter permease [Muribaculaceae bacterium]|nr:ABC transporter permease [Muribaculaceae bacterium]